MEQNEGLRGDILVALAGGDSLPMNELADIVNTGRPEPAGRALGGCLRWMISDRLVARTREGLYSITEIGRETVFMMNQNGRKEMPAVSQNRATFTVSLHQAPIILEDIVQVELVLLSGGCIKMPVFGNIRIGRGEGIYFGATQVVNTGVKLIRLIDKNGKQQEHPVLPSELVVIDQG